MPDLVTPRTESEECAALETVICYIKASEFTFSEYDGNGNMGMTYAGYVLCILFNIYIPIGVTKFGGKIENIQKHKDPMKQINNVRCNANIVSYLGAQFDSLSSFDKTSRLQQKRSSPASDLDSSCADLCKYGNIKVGGVASKADNESYPVITNNPYCTSLSNKDIKIKLLNEPCKESKSEVVLQQDMVGHAELKTDYSQGHLRAQIVPSSGSGSPCTGSGSPRSECESTSSESGSPSFGSGSTSSESGSPSSGSWSPSFESGPTNSYLTEPSHAISSSRTEQPSGCIKETAKESSRLLDSDLSLNGQKEHDTACEEDIALGTNCAYEFQQSVSVECSTQVLPSSIQDIFNTLNDESCKQNPRNLSWLSHSDIPGKCASTLPDVYSQTKLNYQFKAIDDNVVHRNSLLPIVMDEDCLKDNEWSENEEVECFVEPVGESKKSEVGEITEDKCHLAIYRNEDCDIDTELPEAEFSIEHVVKCKKSEVEVAAEQEMQENKSANKNNYIVLKNGKYRKHQHAEDIYFNIWDEMMESLLQRIHLSNVTRFYESFSSASHVKDRNELLIKSKSKATVGRDADAASPRSCNCLHPQKCFHNKNMSGFSTLESGGQDLENRLGLRLPMKFDPSRHLPWRYNNEVFNQTVSVAPNSLYIFMNFEVFRLSSFILKNFPKDASRFVTHLAKSGFYCMSQSVQIICFGCGNEFEGSQDSSPTSAESLHSPLCTRHVSNKPIDQWLQGVNLDALTEYFLQNGSLMPFIEETSPAVGVSSSRRATSKNALEAKPVSDLQSCIDNFSSGYESEGLQYVESERETRSDSQRLLTDSSLRAIYENPSSNHSGSLPSNLNEISGVVVCEERSQPEGSDSVLTSATRRPLLYRSTSSNADHGDEAAEEGAVGGAFTFYLDCAAYPHFSIEAVRMTSFTAWSPQHSHTPEHLAAAGFFYAGYSDCVRCFYCGLGLKYWRPTDIPTYQHAKYRPQCRFNILYKGQEYVDKVQQELFSVQDATNRVEAQATPAQPQESVQTTITSQVSGSPQEMDYMSSEAAKEALRNGWTRDQVHKAVSHIVSVYGESCLEAELLTDILTHFNTLDEPSESMPNNSSAGSNDSGINSTVSQSTTSQPSSATLVNALAVRDERQDRFQADQTTQEGATAVSTSHGQQPGVRVPDLKEMLTSVEREHSLLEARVTCRVCKSRPVGCIYLPCGHVIACQECADNATNCVFCRKQIIGTANIFLA